MSRRLAFILAAAIATGALAAGTGYAMLQADAAASLRASGKAGEQADGYLGVVEGGGDVRAQVEAVNIKRRAYYTDLAAKRGAKIEEVAATTACELFRSKVAPGQFYRGTDGQWRQRGAGPVPLPAYCG
ncbi:MAG TPA: YdbL family protein [Allosphingosinicella sp.]|jgi:hypothetical protein